MGKLYDITLGMCLVTIVASASFIGGYLRCESKYKSELEKSFNEGLKEGIFQERKRIIKKFQKDFQEHEPKLPKKYPI